MMDPTDTTEQIDTDVEQTHRPLITPEAFLMVQNLISLAINPKEVRKHLRQLHDALAAVDAAEKRLNDARVAHDAHIAQTTAELEQMKKTAVDIWKTAQAREHAVERREQAVREGPAPAVPPNYRHPEDTFTPIEGSGMSRTFTAPRRTVRHDDLGQPFPSHTTLTREAE